jgi:hypothetical protein
MRESMMALNGAIRPVDLRRHEELLSVLPLEFALYARGAAAWCNADTTAAMKHWQTLLALPEKERRYHSTWATFMLGKALLEREPQKAVGYFEETRRLAAAGFRDTARLGPSSLGWQALIEEKSGRRVAAINHYFEMFKSDSVADHMVGYTSLRFLCWRALAARRGQLDPAVARDPLCRRIVTAWLVANGGYFQTGRDRQWLEAVTAAGGGKAPLEGADQLAWAAYRLGDMKAAARWVETADPRAPYARWVQSKLLLRAGKVDEAMKILRSLTAAFPQSEAWPDSANWYNVYPRDNVYAESGILNLGRKDYVTALDDLLRSDYWPDAAYVAERVLTIDELETYIKQHANDAELNAVVNTGGGDACGKWLEGTSAMTSLRHLMARRLARQHEWARARPYYPDNPASYEYPEKLVTVFDKFVNHLKAGEDAKRDARPRAEELYRAATLAHHAGMDLFGTEDDPDGQLAGGLYADMGATSSRLADKDAEAPGAVDPLWVLPSALTSLLKASADEKARAAASRPTPNKRFHYRYYAADLMWQCAGLLPDNDPLTAQALWTGGRWIAPRDPQAADRFYKALVRRCGQLPVGQEADKLRWFPRNAPPMPKVLEP